MKEWKLYVENFGKIENAELTIKPFTCFVGDNNSNKSYMMTLIYGIINIDLITKKNCSFKYDFLEGDEEFTEFKKAVDHCKNMEIDSVFKIDENFFKIINSLFNKVINGNKDIFIKSIFNSDVRLGRIKVDFEFNKKMVIEKYIEQSEEKEEVRYHLRTTGSMYHVGFSDVVVNNYISMLELLMQAIINFNYNSVILRAGGHYLPTSRTGFVLTRKTLVSESIKANFTNIDMIKTENNLLTKPCSDFLSEISSVSNNDINRKFTEIVKFIEEMIIDGKLLIDEETNDFMYKPNGVEEKIPMFLSSGVITEMTPLLLLLKYKRHVSTIMMEEPEMCLHPKLQWLIARALIQIVNNSTSVVITTHSDTIIQHVNNMIKLNNNGNKFELMKKYDYYDQDLLKEDQIIMYQFDVDNHKTKIKEVKSGEYGFEAETFNKMLMSLLEESREFEE